MRCSGCFNPHHWNPQGGRETPVEELAAGRVAAEAEGIILLDGELFEQASACAALAEAVCGHELSVMVFSGYEREYLKDGSYQADKPDLIRPWVGSANQRFHFPTNRYRHLEQRLASTGWSPIPTS